MTVALQREMAAATGVLPMAGVWMSGSPLFGRLKPSRMGGASPAHGDNTCGSEGNGGCDRSYQHYILRGLTPDAVG